MWHITYRNCSKNIWMFSPIPSIIVPLHPEWFVSDACEHSFFFFFSKVRLKGPTSHTTDSGIPFLPLPFLLFVSFLTVEVCVVYVSLWRARWDKKAIWRKDWIELWLCKLFNGLMTCLKSNAQIVIYRWSSICSTLQHTKKM